MSELKSKCCRDRVYESYDVDPSCTKPVINYRCLSCGKITEVKEQRKPQDTALYASLRR